IGDQLEIFLKTEIQEKNNLEDQQKENLKKLANSKFFQENWHIIYEDEDLLVVNKPSGIAVHPGTDHYQGRTMIDLAQAYRLGDDFLPMLIHRLDIGTSGVLVFAKNNLALQNLNAQIKARKTTKIYYALCDGHLEKKQGSIRLALERTEGRSKSTKVIVSRGGEKSQMAITHYRVIQEFKEASLVEVKIETGRMHQIRVHFKSQGHPLWGDRHYGDFKLNHQIEKAPYNLKRIFLHAHFLELNHPSTQQKIQFKAELGNDLQSLLKQLNPLL
nr:RluA family pseudouridine synthase [Candidatus Gracilibacteria bacterium]